MSDSMRPSIHDPEDSETLERVHLLKTWPCFFQAVQRGEKCFELRRDDRKFAVGDCLVLQEFDPETERYSGNEVALRVTYLTREFMPEGFVAMSTQFVGHADPVPAASREQPSEPPQPTLLERAISDRDARPWRYYRFEYDDLKKWCEKMADERDALRAESAAARVPASPAETTETK